MNNDYLLSADVLDIIFDKKNKGYGAYALRKYYNSRLYKALAVTFGIAALSVSLLLSGSKKNVTINVPDPYVVANYLLPKEPVLPRKPDLPKAKLTAAPKLNTQQWVNRVVITNAATVPLLPKNLDSLVIGSQTISGPGKVNMQNVESGPGDRDDTKENIAIPATSAAGKTTVLETAEIMPEYPGGMGALRKFLERNLHNPQDLEDGGTVSVRIKFVVGYDGVLKGFETIEDGGKAFNNEVISVLKKMPAWIPGKSKGENVSVFYTIPVKFTPAE